MENTDQHPEPAADSATSGRVVAHAKVIVMQIELILQIIGWNLLADDLWSLRSTCSLWNHTFLPRLREKHEIKNCNRSISIPEWTHLMRTTATEIPVAKYCLDNLHKSRAQVFIEFFGVCGNIITHLDLKFSFGRPLQWNVASRPLNLDQLRWIIFEKTPNLVDLRFGVSRRDTAPNPISDSMRARSYPRDLPKLRFLEFYIAQDARTLHTGYGKLLADILRHATRLECLSLGTAFGIKNWHVLSALADRNPAPPPCLSKLSCLVIYKLDVPELEIMLNLASRSQSPLQLTTFVTSIDYLYENVFGNVLVLLARFLASQSSTLRHFSLKLQPGSTYHIAELTIPATTTIEFPTLPAVQTFHFDCSGLEQAPQDQAGYRCRRQPFTKPLDLIFPGLVRFEYVNTWALRDGLEQSHNDPHVANKDDMQGLRHPGVTDLCLHTNYVGGQTPAAIGGGSEIFCKTYGSCFALHRLTRLEIHLRPDSLPSIFQAICASMPALELLHIICEAADFRKSEWDLAPGTDLRHSAVEFQPRRRPQLVPMETNAPVTTTTVNILELDSILTGVPSKNLEDLRRVLTVLATPTVTLLENFLQKYKTTAGLQDLCSLKRFTMEILGLSFRLTDIGGYFGLAVGSPKLQYITIEAFESGDNDKCAEKRKSREPRGEKSGNWISRQCEQALLNIFGPALVISF